jgi:hypothetical protein
MREVNLFSAYAIARASSHFGTIDTFGPLLAIDGKVSHIAANFFHSETELQPWLEIAFPNEIKISRVEITNR